MPTIEQIAMLGTGWVLVGIGFVLGWYIRELRYEAAKNAVDQFDAARLKQMSLQDTPDDGGRIGCPECGDFYWDRAPGDTCPGCDGTLVAVRSVKGEGE